MSKRLYVGGLSFDTSEQALKKACEQHGEVTDVKVIVDRETGLSRGFGFVTYAKADEADHAMEAMSGRALDGRILIVNEARERSNSRRGNDSSR